MRVLIVDDEPAARRRLAIMLEELDVEVVGEAANGVEALEQVQERLPDVLLLDIAMPEVDGLDVARHLRDPKPLIIFQTAYDEYALSAFEHDALDYVVKPVTLDRLKRALERARERLAAKSRPALTIDLLEQLERAVSGVSSARRPRVLVRDGTGRLLVPFSEIIKFAADEGIVCAHTAAGVYPTDYTLADLETRSAGGFVRVNRAELVNVDHVARIASNGDGSATITLSNGRTVHVSRRRAGDVRSTLEA
ncbi:MAG: response regulator [Gemmatimonadetes bacterium]|nr:response regulator [Gemmatimonadota bacterium]